MIFYWCETDFGKGVNAQEGKVYLENSWAKSHKTCTIGKSIEKYTRDMPIHHQIRSVVGSDPYISVAD